MEESTIPMIVVAVIEHRQPQEALLSGERLSTTAQVEEDTVEGNNNLSNELTDVAGHLSSLSIQASGAWVHLQQPAVAGQNFHFSARRIEEETNHGIDGPLAIDNNNNGQVPNDGANDNHSESSHSGVPSLGDRSFDDSSDEEDAALLARRRPMVLLGRRPLGVLAARIPLQFGPDDSAQPRFDIDRGMADESQR